MKFSRSLRVRGPSLDEGRCYGNGNERLNEKSKEKKKKRKKKNLIRRNKEFIRFKYGK